MAIVLAVPSHVLVVQTAASTHCVACEASVRQVARLCLCLSVAI